MKKALLFLFALCSLTSSAQLKVYTNGNVGVDPGVVVVENGTSVISYTSEVVIENDFEVKPGACLEIRKAN